MLPPNYSYLPNRYLYKYLISKIIIYCFLCCFMLNTVLSIVYLGLLRELRLNDRSRDGESWSKGYYNAWSLKSQIQFTAPPQTSWIALEDGFVSLWLTFPSVTWTITVWLWELRYETEWTLQCYGSCGCSQRWRG